MAREPRAAQADEGPLSQLEAALRAERPPPLLFLLGKERYLVDRAIDTLKAALLDPATRDFNYDVFTGKDAQPQRVLSAARTLPMMARQRLVLIRDADEINAEQLNALCDYLARPVPETCLCFIAEKADQRIRFFTQFKKHGLLLKMDPLTERQLPGFVRAEAERRGVRLEPGAAERIAMEIGADLGQLADAVERLASYVEPGAPIRISDVEEVVATTRQHTVFELIDAVGAAEQGRALGLLCGILASREPPLRLLALLLRHVRQIWMVNDLMSGSRRATQGEVAQTLGVPPFVASKLMDQAQRLSAARIGAMHEAIYQADRALKLSRLDDERHMEGLVLRLCAPQGAR